MTVTAAARLLDLLTTVDTEDRPDPQLEALSAAQKQKLKDIL